MKQIPSMSLYELLSDLYEDYLLYAQSSFIDPKMLLAELITFAAHRSATGFVILTQNFNLQQTDIERIVKTLSNCFDLGLRAQLNLVKNTIH